MQTTLISTWIAAIARRAEAALMGAPFAAAHIAAPFAAALLLLVTAPAARSQSLRGRVHEPNGKAVAYAAVYLQNTGAGATTDSAGLFIIRTTLTGRQTLIVSALGYSSGSWSVALPYAGGPLDLVLRPNPRELGPVVITVGTMNATGDRVLSILQPVDILSNASSQGDLLGAIENLPGVQRNGGDQTGLFVRGGDASETQVILDGAVIQDPYFSDVPGIGQRSRFDPFQVKGLSFSSGGYGARYGQALSAVLDLHSTDLPDKSTIASSVFLGGGIVSGVQRQGDDALEYTASFTDFGPYYGLTGTNYSFFQKPWSIGGSMRWISRSGDKGLFKMTVNYADAGNGAYVPNPEDPATLLAYSLRNENLSLVSTYAYRVSKHFQWSTDLAFSNNQDHILWNDTVFLRTDNRVQGRLEGVWSPGGSWKITMGTEVQHYGYFQRFDTLGGAFTETLSAGYAQAEYKPFRRMAVQAGVRAEHSAVLERGNVAPRLALALKSSPYMQFGVAGGIFYQTVPAQYLILGYRPGFERAVHYLANLEWVRHNRWLRLEGYYKQYGELVRELGEPYSPVPLDYRYSLGTVNNSGYGYARGADLFWRDKSSIPGLDCWLTYSYVDTRRLYENYPAEATPDFVSTHNLNLIFKYYSDGLHTAFSAGYNFASGRPYYDPQSHLFLGEHSPAYQNVSCKASYLTHLGKFFTVFYVNIDDLTDYKNVLGYRYSANGQLRTPILPPQYFSLLFGVYLSIDAFKKDEL